jgi:hypothetical protein
MDVAAIFNDNTLKPKEKTERISNSLVNNELQLSDLIDYAKKSKDSIKASCVEAIEFVTAKKPEFAIKECLDFVSDCLTETAPRIKWESARVVGNIAHLFPDDLDKATVNLLKNSEHTGTVVRWSTAFALGKISTSESPLAPQLIEVCKQLASREEKNSIKKIYLQAIKVRT